jgi:hypothetical protein
MTATPAIGMSSVAANYVLERKLDSLPFSPYQVLLIAVLGAAGFVDGYGLAVTGSLLVLGVAAPFLMASHTGSPTIFFGAILLVVSMGAFIPVLFGGETVGQLEAFTEAVPVAA